MKASAKLHTSATLHPGKQPWYPLERMAGWTLEQAWILQRRDKFLAPARNQTPNFYSPGTKLTDLSSHTSRLECDAMQFGM